MASNTSKDYFICLPLRGTPIDHAMRAFVAIHGLSPVVSEKTRVPTWDPHITLSVVSCEDDTAFGKLCAALDELQQFLALSGVEVYAGGLCCIQQQAIGTKMGKFRLSGLLSNAPPKGQLLVDIKESQGLRHVKSVVFGLPIGKWARQNAIPGVGVIAHQNHSHITFEGTRGMLKKKKLWDTMRAADKDGIEFGRVVVREVWICEMKAGLDDGLYMIAHRIGVQMPETSEDEANEQVSDKSVAEQNQEICDDIF